MKIQKPLAHVLARIALLLSFTSLLLAAPLGSTRSNAELFAPAQCPGGFPPPCTPPPPPIRRPTPRASPARRPQTQPIPPQHTKAPATPTSTPTSTPTTSSSAPVRDECSFDAKYDLYASFRQHYKTDQAKAYNDAKKYLSCPAGAVTESEQLIIDYLKKWTAAYDAGSREIRLLQLIYNEKKYPEGYTLGREILTSNPDSLKVLVHLGVNGYLVQPLKSPSLTAQALDYAKRALALIDAGRSLDDWQPLKSHAAAVAYLNFTIGSATLENDPSTALKHLVKAMEVETPLKTSPFSYAYIAGAYETGPYAKQAEEYQRIYAKQDETPESKLALAKIYKIVDRMIDSYARAVALAGNDAQFATGKAAWIDSLRTWYKFRNNNSDAGLNELIASILSTPLPSSPLQ